MSEKGASVTETRFRDLIEGFNGSIEMVGDVMIAGYDRPVLPFSEGVLRDWLTLTPKQVEAVEAIDDRELGKLLAFCGPHEPWSTHGSREEAVRHALDLAGTDVDEIRMRVGDAAENVARSGRRALVVAGADYDALSSLAGAPPHDNMALCVGTRLGTVTLLREPEVRHVHGVADATGEEVMGESQGEKVRVEIGASVAEIIRPGEVVETVDLPPKREGHRRLIVMRSDGISNYQWYAVRETLLPKLDGDFAVLLKHDEVLEVYDLPPRKES